MRKTLSVVATLLVLGAVVTGCGSSSKSNNSSSAKASGSTTTTGAQSSSAKAGLSGQVNDKGTTTLSGSALELEADDLYFKPTFIKAKPGTKVEVKLENEGQRTHTFTIDSLHVNAELAPGAKKTVEVTLPASGNVPFYCQFHKGLGMQGAFELG